MAPTNIQFLNKSNYDVAKTRQTEAILPSTKVSNKSEKSATVIYCQTS